jgi:hypothetical protein
MKITFESFNQNNYSCKLNLQTFKFFLEAWILKLRVVFQNCEFIVWVLAINCELSKWGVSSPVNVFWVCFFKLQSLNPLKRFLFTKHAKGFNFSLKTKGKFLEREYITSNFDSKIPSFYLAKASFLQDMLLGMFFCFFVCNHFCSAFTPSTGLTSI